MAETYSFRKAPSAYAQAFFDKEHATIQRALQPLSALLSTVGGNTPILLQYADSQAITDDYYPLHINVTFDPPSNVTDVIEGALIEVYTEPTNTKNFHWLIGGSFYAEHDGSGNIDAVEGAFIGATNNGSGVAAEVTGLEVAAADTGAGSTTLCTGIRILDVTGGVTNYALDVGLGLTRFADLVTTVASAAGHAGLRLPHGAAPTSPVNGDIWTTTAGLFARINGATIGPLS